VRWRRNRHAGGDVEKDRERERADRRPVGTGLGDEDIRLIVQ
jgi:hypothetical protein